MGKLSQEEINVDLFNEIQRLKEELSEWKTGQRQTSEHYNNYKARGVQLQEKDEEIAELREKLKQIQSPSTSTVKIDTNRITKVAKHTFF